MKLAFIGDIVGKPGREIVKKYLSNLKEEYNIDLIIANGENVSHGFGLSVRNANELLSYGIDFITGGNHIWDKKDIIPFLDSMPILRPLNYPKSLPGTGVKITNINNEEIAIINLMGHFTMPLVDNAFLCIKDEVDRLESIGIKNIFIDFHGEATSEKRALFCFLKGKVSAICGTHTHIGTDDLMIEEGTFYVSDVGLSGCRDGVIGMDKEAPLKRFLTGIPASFDISKKCKRILQFVVLEISNGECLNGYKLKVYDDKDEINLQKAFLE